ncbi:MarC family protein [Aquabacterium lacunae]|uniref:UPF0056 membrane protein n=1 Tax=Aquabacterium lacunae TaxID=2528630 RepID=A0A4Q9GZH6_9BURK|nr:MarC family protein [Aquabacterium lacunae]TBO28406.1 MarC family protein [Aquabacterium lacunae]
MQHDLLSAFIVLLIVTDPLGNVPVVLSLLKGVPRARRLWVITREYLIATGLLLLFMVAGERLLRAMRLSEVSLEISGGVILFLIALGMVFPGMGVNMAQRAAPSEPGSEAPAEPLLVPLATPLIAGPSALATVVLLASRQPEQASAWGAAIVLAMGCGWCVLAMAEHLSHRLNPVALRAMERFMGLLLSAMAVEMLTSGLRRAFGV